MGNDLLLQYAEKLELHNVYFVGVHCALAVLQARERQRGDRLGGLSNDQFLRAHQGLRPYDLQVDTTDTSALKVAQTILGYLTKDLLPRGLQRLHKP